MDQNNQLRGVLPELPPTVSAAEKRILRRGRNFASKRMLMKSSTGSNDYLKLIVKRRTVLFFMPKPSHFSSLARNVTYIQGAFGAKRSCQYGPKRQVSTTYFFCHISEEDWQKYLISNTLRCHIDCPV